MERLDFQRLARFVEDRFVTASVRGTKRSTPWPSGFIVAPVPLPEAETHYEPGRGRPVPDAIATASDLGTSRPHPAVQSTTVWCATPSPPSTPSTPNL